MVLAGFLAAVMSTISALANSTATIFSLDVYRRLLHPDADDARLVRVGRLASLVSLAIAAIVAPSVAHLGGVFRYFQNGVTYLATPFISVMLVGVLWKRANRRRTVRPDWRFGDHAGDSLRGTGDRCELALALPGRPGAGIHDGGHYGGFAAHARAEEAVWRPFHWTLSALRQYDDGVRRPWYQSVLLWWTVYTLVWLCLYWRFW